jgi:hypothetical protein
MPRKRKDTEKDFLDELTEEWTRQDPHFPERVEDAERRGAFGRALAGARKKRGLTRAQVAKAAGTTAFHVERIELGGDADVSLVARLVATVGAHDAVALLFPKPRRVRPAAPSTLKSTRAKRAR